MVAGTVISFLESPTFIAASGSTAVTTTNPAVVVETKRRERGQRSAPGLRVQGRPALLTRRGGRNWSSCFVNPWPGDPCRLFVYGSDRALRRVDGCNANLDALLSSSLAVAAWRQSNLGQQYDVEQHDQRENNNGADHAYCHSTIGNNGSENKHDHDQNGS